MNAADTPEAVNDDIGLSQRMAEASALLKADSFDAIDYINAVFPTGMRVVELFVSSNILIRRFICLKH